MQMSNASQQGIATLMQKPPGQVPGQQPKAGGQPPMPSPTSASPMAGLGSVDDRVSAYAGNSKPLEQRYAMTQDLLDLLALQKIKSKKDLAARQMQLQMAQQQAQNGEASMTVAQQREKEVTDLTKNELAQQRGDTAQQQTQDQQKKMQQMLAGGLPNAPGAATAAQPIAMAAGGIVGYAGGGEILDKARERRKAAQEKMYSFGTMQRRNNPEAYAAAQADLKAAEEAMQEAEKVYAGEMSTAGADRPAFNRRDVGAVKEAMQGTPAVAPAVSDVYPDETNRGAAANLSPVAAVPAPVVKPPPQVDAAGNPVVARPPMVKPPMQPPVAPAPGASASMVNPMAGGLGSTPAAAAAGVEGAEGAPPAAGNFGQRMEAASLRNAERNSQAEGVAEETRVTDKMALTPDQRKVHEEGIAGLKQMYEQQYDPERQRQEGLKRFLIGAGGRRYGELGGGAAAGLDYDAQQRAAKLKEFGGIQSARTGLIDLDRGAVKEGITAGQKAREGVEKQVTSGLSAGANLFGTNVQGFTNLYNTDATERARTLDREVEKLKVGVTSEANRIARENLGMDKARTFLGATQIKLENTVKDLDKAFQAANGMLLMADPAKLKPEDKNRLDIARAEHERNVTRIRTEMKPVIDSAYAKLGIAAGSDLSAADKALVDKYAKGK